MPSTAPEVFQGRDFAGSCSRGDKQCFLPHFSRFGGLAAMAGISIPNDSNVEQVVATLQSGKFLRVFIKEKNLKPILFEEIWDSENQTWIVESKENEPTEQQAAGFFKNLLSVPEDTKSGLSPFLVLWKDPEVAAMGK